MSSKILLIDDATDLSEIVSDILVKEGFEVALANNGNKGLELFYKFKPHLVISDMVMPGLNGLELVRRIRTDNANNSVKIIIFSAKASKETEDTSLEAGANLYLAKPCEMSVLLDYIRALLYRS